MAMIRGIIIGHETFAEMMLRTAEGIVGKQKLVDVISNTGMSCGILNDKIERMLEQNNENETIVFVDLPGGSCAISCYGVLRSIPNLNIVCGINLPVLIEFFMLREKYPAQELVPILVKKGRESIFKMEQKK